MSGRLQQLRKLQQMDEDDLMMMVMQQAEGRLIDAVEDLDTQLTAKRSNSWRDRDQLIEILSDADADAQETYYTNAMETLIQEIANVCIAYHEVSMTSQDMDLLRDAALALLVTFHNPEIQESLLLAVEEDQREQVREHLLEIGAIMWGWYEATIGEDAGNMDEYLKYAAPKWDMTPDELRATLDGEE